jgi:hypothetical protein
MERWSGLWPTHISEKGRILGKTYEIKSSCYWEHPGGTHWEPREHIEKNPPPQPCHSKLTREKDQGTLSAC